MTLYKAFSSAPVNRYHSFTTTTDSPPFYSLVRLE